MAEVTRQLMQIDGAVLTCTFDDVTLALTRFNLEATRSVHIILWRTGKTPWRDFVLPPGSYQYDAGGPVTNWTDIDRFELIGS